jgi:vacuolar-type H+-ATPase subunit D/Vma8
MTIKEKSDKLYQSFLAAWENYQKIEREYAKSTGFNELLSAPELKKAYQKWQTAVSDYYDFARSIENKRLSEPFTGS